MSTVKIKNSRQKIANILLSIGCVNINFKNKFTLTSGKKSPVYVDCRKLVSFPKEREIIINEMSKQIKDIYKGKIIVAGGETAGIPFAAWIADKMSLPMQYVRKKPKGYGRDAQIEGDIYPNQRVLLVEDLTTDGGSKLMFADAIRRAEAICEHILVVFYYDIFENTHEMLAENGLKLHYLLTWWDILGAARDGGNFDAKSLDQVETFLKNPLEWSAANGGISKLSVSK